MIARIQKVGCPVRSYRGAVPSCASPIPKSFPWSHLVAKWAKWLWSYFSLAAIFCTTHKPYIRMSIWTVITTFSTSIILFLFTDIHRWYFKFMIQSCSHRRHLQSWKATEEEAMWSWFALADGWLEFHRCLTIMMWDIAIAIFAVVCYDLYWLSMSVVSIFI